MQFSSLFETYNASKYEIRYQGCRLHWSSSFVMAHPKESWQYWRFGIVKNPSMV